MSRVLRSLARALPALVREGWRPAITRARHAPAKPAHARVPAVGLAVVLALAGSGCAELPGGPPRAGASPASEPPDRAAPVGTLPSGLRPPALPSSAAIDARVQALMRHAGVQGLAVAVVDEGSIRHVGAYGVRNARGDPLRTDTVMYGASLTKTAFAHVVLQLVQEGRLSLDDPIGRLLDRPLPDYAPDRRYGPWHHLAGDERWRAITPRMLLTHSAGFANFAYLEPDRRLRIHFQPGTRYAYSGEGMMLLQFVLEQGLGLDLGREMQRRLFDRLGMARTSMTWRADFAGHAADGFTAAGTVEPHDERSRVRAAGSMDTTIADMARLAAAVVGEEGLTADMQAEFTRPQLPVRSAHQFPTLQADAAPHRQVPGLAAGLGVLVRDGPQGRIFFKGGHNDSTGNLWLCVMGPRRCLVLLSNDLRAEALFPQMAEFVLGDVGMPWTWEYPFHRPM